MKTFKARIKDLKKSLKSVLIVEDDPDLLDVLAASIVSWGYQVVSTKTLNGALEKITNQQFDLILLDLKLKNQSSLKVVDLIRGNPTSLNYRTSILIHSGELDMEILSDYQHDIDDVLLKPSTNEAIKEKVVACANKVHQPSVLRKDKERYTIFMLDDDLSSVEDVKKGFSSSRISLITGDSIMEAKLKLERQRFDYIILSVDISGRSTMQILFDLWKVTTQINYSTPVMIIGDEIEDKIRELLTDSVHRIETKPLQVAELKESIMTMLKEESLQPQIEVVKKSS